VRRHESETPVGVRQYSSIKYFYIKDWFHINISKIIHPFNRTNRPIAVRGSYSQLICVHQSEAAARAIAS
jgi:hypothetical protein